MSFIPKNVTSVLLIGEDMDYVLFRTAICCAETGQYVWFISPETFTEIPKKLKPPDKEILKLITFMYLKDYKDLITHLHGIHLWRNTPNVIIVTGYETYCGFNSKNYNSLQAALVTTSLLDSSAVCARKTNSKISVIVSCTQLDSANLSKLQVLNDFYFQTFMYKTDNENFYNKLMEVVK